MATECRDRPLFFQKRDLYSVKNCSRLPLTAFKLPTFYFFVFHRNTPAQLVFIHGRQWDLISTMVSKQAQCVLCAGFKFQFVCLVSLMVKHHLMNVIHENHFLTNIFAKVISYSSILCASHRLSEHGKIRKRKKTKALWFQIELFSHCVNLITGICSRAIKVPLLLKRLNMDGKCSGQSQEIRAHVPKASKLYNLLTNLWNDVRWNIHSMGNPHSFNFSFLEVTVTLFTLGHRLYFQSWVWGQNVITK